MATPNDAFNLIIFGGGMLATHIFQLQQQITGQQRQITQLQNQNAAIVQAIGRINPQAICDGCNLFTDPAIRAYRCNTCG